MNSQAQLEGSNPKISAFVTASAGTGKTKMLVDRIFRLLINGIPLSSILCVTFTKAAALEMRTRILELFEKILHMNNTEIKTFLLQYDIKILTEEECTKIKNIYFTILNEQQNFKIQTIHSFCQSFLDINAVFTNMLPPFKILDDEQKKILILKAFSKTCQNKEYSAHLNVITEKMALSYFLEMLIDAISLNIDDIQKSKNLNIPTSNDLKFKDIEKDVQNLPAKLAQIISKKGINDFFLSKSGSIRKRFLKKDDAKEFPNIEEKLFDIAEKLEELIDQEKTQQFLELNRSFFTIIEAVKNEYSAIKQLSSTLDFDDLILETARILSLPESGMIHEKLGYKLEAILIDEAQDTSPRQWEILIQLIENMLLKESEKTSLLVVGDIKQSIYSFQGADPKTFLNVRDHLKNLFTHHEKPFKQLALEKSFRSSESVLKTVDNIFNQHPFGLHLENNKLQHKVHRQDAGFVHVFPIESKIEQDNKNTENLTEHDILAENIANQVQTLINEHGYAPKDILILFRNRHVFINKIHNALIAKNIASSGTDKVLLKEHPFVIDLLYFFQILLAKDDDYSFYMSLKSPLYSIEGIDEKLVYNIVQQKKNTPFYYFLKEDFTKNHYQLNNFIQFFKKYLSKLGYISLSETLHNVWYEKNRFFLDKYGSEAFSFFEHLYNSIYKLEKNNNLSPQEIVWHLKTEDIEIKKDISEKESNHVRLMTIHGSKGLEAPVVILADANIQQTLQKEKIIPYEDFYILKPSDENSPKHLKPLKQQMLQKLHEEDRRLLYVAITRARDALFIFGQGKSIDDSWYDHLQKYHHNTEEKLKNIIKTPQETNNDVVIPPYIFEPITLKPSKKSDVIENQKSIKRGIKIHELLEILPHVGNHNIEDFCLNFFNKNEDIFENNDAQKILAFLQHPDYKTLLTQNSLNEVSVSYCGDIYRVDKLIIKEDHLIILDFKTGKRTPQKIKQYFKKMDVYKKAFMPHYPNKKIMLHILWIDEWIMDKA